MCQTSMDNQVGIGIVIGVGVIGLALWVQWLLVWRHPVEQVEARVVGKRQSISGGGQGGVSTTYHVTLERSGGKRREYQIGVSDYSLLAERDRITCEIQGAALRKIKRLH